MPKNRFRVVVLGAGGHGKVVLDALLAAEEHEVVGVLDDNPVKQGAHVLGVPVIGTSENLSGLASRLGFEGVAVALGDNYLRERKFREVRAARLKPVTLIHPAATVSRFVELGEGVVILAKAVINPGTSIADNVCVNTSASVDHDNVLERSSHIFPNATLAGGVSVGEFSQIGCGAVVNPNLKIGKHSYVGAGAVVTRDVAEGVVAAGIPAREIKKQPRRQD
jgi:sugar O-acyltransferase (sialic acid O-acetyltransferase NeuD family)